jgi:type VI secretion system protein ImpA
LSLRLRTFKHLVDTALANGACTDEPTMTQFDLNRLLAPINEASPTGENLEYDPEFAELDRVATPKSERSIGDSVKAAEEPDWDKVANQTEALFERTKDLRTAIHLTAAWTRGQGLAGWNAGLGLVRGLLENYWDGVHPQLDADDDNDPTARANAVMPLSDPQSVLGYFRTTPFVHSPRLGRFSLRELRIATGALKATPPADGSPLPTMVEVEACCMDCPDNELPDAAAVLAEALGHARAIDTLLIERLSTASPDLTHLTSDIHELKKFVDAQVARRFPGLAVENAGANAEDESGGPVKAEVWRSDRTIQGSNDVVLRIDEICEYYDRNEPSSPVPILLRRARRLVGKSFSEVLKNLAPGGLSELQVLSGPDEE